VGGESSSDFDQGWTKSTFDRVSFYKASLAAAIHLDAPGWADFRPF
jgi:hypothetical protein